MREHQIVITLKPEQFLQVQRLSRNAGAKSMGIFVRQKLLRTLGIEGNADAVPDQAGTPQLEPLITELKRLHMELKSFAVESLSWQLPVPAIVENNYGESPDAEPIISPSLPDEASIQSIVTDDLEMLADRTFAISPRLGSLEANLFPTPPIEFKPNNEAAELRDPLSDLLGDDDFEQTILEPDFDPENIEEDPDFAVPPALAERKKQLEAAQSIEATPSIENQIETTSTKIDIKEETPAKKYIRNTDEEPDQEDQKPQTPAPQPVDNTGSPHPISGGPPPKRRQ